MGGLETLLPTLGAGGVGGILLAVIVYLLRTNQSDRKDYREAVSDWEGQFDDQVDRYRELQQRLDEERDLRRKAEDSQSRATMATERMKYEIAALRDEVKALRSQVAEMKGS